MAAKSVSCVVGIYKRRTDLGDELPVEEQREVLIQKGHVRWTREMIPSGTFGPDGLLDSSTFQNSLRSQKKNLVRAERSVLLTTTRMLEAVRSFAADNADLKVAPAFGPGLFGEQICIDGELGSKEICIGDELGFFRSDDATEPTLRLRVASPRRPCHLVDEKHGKTYSTKGVRSHVARTSNGGVFCSVVGGGGDLRQGDVMRVLDRPNPSWSSFRVASLLYGSERAYMKMKKLSRTDWCGTQAELKELANVKELAAFEYKEELYEMLGRPSIGQYKTPRSSSISLNMLLLAVVLVFLAVALAQKTQLL